MERPRQDFLAGASLAQDQDRTRAGSKGRQNLEYPLHKRAAAGKVAHTIFTLQFPAQQFDLGKIAKGFGAANHSSFGILKNRGGNADRDAIALGVDDVAGSPDHGFSGFQCLLQSAFVAAHTGTENLSAASANSLFARHAGDFLGSPVKRGNAPLHVNRKNTVGNTLKNGLGR